MRFESRCDTAERLALSAQFLVLPRAEERFASGGVCSECCAAVGLGGEDVRLESERVDELGNVCVWELLERLMMASEKAYVWVHAFGERVDVWRELYL